MAKSGEQAIQMMGKVKPDLVLLDVKMPGMDGYETFEKIKNIPEYSDIPIIFLTADRENESELKGLRLGACDFIRKPYEPEVMLGRIERVIRQEDKNREIRDAAMKDSLTGLWNRSYMDVKINELLKADVSGSFLVLDLDNFKGINDTYGHVIGDAALVAFANTLKRFVHKDDIVARIGGDEFAVFLKNSFGKELLSSRIDSLIKEVEHELCVIKENASISSVSVGIAAFPFDGRSFGELYNNADKALYYVKHNGKSGFHFYDAEEKYSFSDSEHSEVLDLSQLRGFIEETDSIEGPFNVEYSSFKNIYRFLRRYVSRTGNNIQILLFSLKDLSMQNKLKKNEIATAMNTLESCIRQSLRKNDVSARYTSTQHLVILMDVDSTKRQAVVDRILDLWNQSNTNQNIILKFDIEELTEESDED